MKDNAKIINLSECIKRGSIFSIVDNDDIVLINIHRYRHHSESFDKIFSQIEQALGYPSWKN